MNAQTNTTCPCGTFAIGLCAECEIAVCGDHSGMIEGRRLCTDDWRAVRDAQVAQREAAEQARRNSAAEAAEARRAGWRKALNDIELERRRLNSQGNPGAEKKKSFPPRMRGERTVRAWKVMDVSWQGAAGNGERGDQSAHRATDELFLTTTGIFAMHNGVRKLCEWEVDQDARSAGGFVIREEHLAGTLEALRRLGRA